MFPAEMKTYWEERDPIGGPSGFLLTEKFWTKAGKRSSDDFAFTGKRPDFAENYPCRRREFARTGRLCTGDDATQDSAKCGAAGGGSDARRRQRPAVGTVEGFGSGKGSGGGSDADSFWDTEGTSGRRTSCVE